MTQKYFSLCALVTTILTVTASWAQTSTTDLGVEINGIVWATRNVDAPGTFTENQTDPGMLYQWNHQIGWSFKDPIKATDGSTEWHVASIHENSQGSRWLPANDPCPAGWRVPTSEEVLKLCDGKKVNNEWIIETLTPAGRKFTDKKSGNFIFIPVTAYRFPETGKLGKVTSTTDYGYGEYWSASARNNYGNGWRFNDKDIFADVATMWSYAQSVRCVKADQNYDSERLAVQTLPANVESNERVEPAAGKPGQGVEINGVIWATCNLDAPGTFAEKPTDAGMFYQWNKNVGWSISGPFKATDGSTNWDNKTQSKDVVVWAPENDPCPEGWRVPTKEEFEKLCDTEKVGNWKIGSVKGCNFTDKENGNSIFFPVSGYRKFTDGQLQQADTYGCYWSASAQEGTAMSHIMGIYSSPKAKPSSIYKNSGINIRCVAK